MLSRTADHLYWMSRYIERAESLARLVDAHYRMSLLPHSGETLRISLSATMKALHMEEAYRERLRQHRAARRVRIREPRPRIQRQHLQLLARGARECPRGARLVDLRIVGNAEFHLAGHAHLGAQRARTRTSASSSNGSRNARTSRAGSPSAPCFASLAMILTGGIDCEDGKS